MVACYATPGPEQVDVPLIRLLVVGHVVLDLVCFLSPRREPGAGNQRSRRVAGHVDRVRPDFVPSGVHHGAVIRWREPRENA